MESGNLSKSVNWSKYNTVSPEKYYFLVTIKWLSVSLQLENKTKLKHKQNYANPLETIEMEQGQRKNYSAIKGSLKKLAFLFFTLQRFLNTSPM